MNSDQHFKIGSIYKIIYTDGNELEMKSDKENCGTIIYVQKIPASFH